MGNKDQQVNVVSQDGFEQLVDTRKCDCLKEDINNFIWTRLPDGTTLAEAEKIAVKIFGIMQDENNRFL